MKHKRDFSQALAHKRNLPQALKHKRDIQQPLKHNRDASEADESYKLLENSSDNPVLDLTGEPYNS
jgi:hypothetical protein